MLNWFKKRRIGNMTITDSTKGVTVSRSSGVKGYRVTDTFRSFGKGYRTITRKSGGLTSRTRKYW